MTPTARRYSTEKDHQGPVGLLLCSIADAGFVIDDQWRIFDGQSLVIDLVKAPIQVLRPRAIEIARLGRQRQLEEARPLLDGNAGIGPRSLRAP